MKTSTQLPQLISDTKNLKSKYQSEIENLDDLFLKYLAMGEAIGMSNRDILEFKNINQRLQNKLLRMISKFD